MGDGKCSPPLPGNGKDEEARLRYEYAGIIFGYAAPARQFAEGAAWRWMCRCSRRSPGACSRISGTLQKANRFRGHPVMGILETRNLDFRNVLLLSMNDDNFPGNPAASSSFIPIICARVTDCPPQHHDGVYAYYFLPASAAAERADMVYSSRTERTVRANRADISIG